MELRQLKYFIKAAELQNFTEAASILYITQSTLSQQIKQLEDELGIPLFDRIAKRVRLTEAGKIFLPYALKTWNDAEDGKMMLNDLMNLNTGQLSIGVTYGLSHLLENALIKFSKLYPNIKIQIFFGTTSDLLSQLELGKIDFLLSFYSSYKKENFSSEQLFKAQLSLIIRKESSIQLPKKLSLDKLKDIPLILPSNDFSIRNYLNQILEPRQLNLNILMEVNEINMILSLVNKGDYATILMNTSLFNHPNLQAIPFYNDEMSRYATVTWDSNTYRKKSVTEIIKLL